MKNAEDAREFPQMVNHVCKIIVTQDQSYYLTEIAKDAKITSFQCPLGHPVEQGVLLRNATKTKR